MYLVLEQHLAFLISVFSVLLRFSNLRDRSSHATYSQKLWCSLFFLFSISNAAFIALSVSYVSTFLFFLFGFARNQLKDHINRIGRCWHLNSWHKKLMGTFNNNLFNHNQMTYSFIFQYPQTKEDWQQIEAGFEREHI